MDLREYRNQVIKRAGVVLAALVAGSGAVWSWPDGFKIGAGLLVGGSCSVLVFWLKVGEVVRAKGFPRRQAQGKLLRRYFLSYGTMAVVLVGCGMTSWVNLWAAGAGLLLCNLVMIVSAAFQGSSSTGQQAASKSG